MPADGNIYLFTKSYSYVFSFISINKFHTAPYFLGANNNFDAVNYPHSARLGKL